MRKYTMSKQQAISSLLREEALYDPKDRKVYIPDVTEPYCFHGVEIASLYIADEEILSLIDDGLIADDSVVVMVCNDIPAPGAVQNSSVGRRDFHGFEPPCFTKRDAKGALNDFVDSLSAKGILSRLVKERDILDAMRAKAHEKEAGAKKCKGKGR